MIKKNNFSRTLNIYTKLTKPFQKCFENIKTGPVGTFEMDKICSRATEKAFLSSGIVVAKRRKEALSVFTWTIARKNFYRKVFPAFPGESKNNTSSPAAVMISIM